MTALRVHDTDTDLSRLLKQVEAGTEVVILHDNRPVARMIPETAPSRRRGSRIGTMEGRLSDPSDAILEPWTDYDLGLSEWENKPL